MDPAAATYGQVPEVAAQEDAQKAFSASVLISAIRCTLTYVVFPFAAPALGIAAGVGSTVGIVASVIGIAANVFSIRRFHGSGHRWRWHITAINVGIIVLLSVLLALDLSDLT
jgi:hypothetical protein